jgi:uncharacterized protein (TIGR02147 family)
LDLEVNIFRHLDYKNVLQDSLKENSETYGFKSRLAEAAGCQKSFLSQVLGGPIHLTPDHAANLCEFWKLSPAEREYFMELIQYARAGTKTLKEYSRKRIERFRLDQENLSKRFQEKKEIPDAAAAIYYSAWHFSATHMLLTIPEFRTPEKIAERLQVPKPFAIEILKTLQSIGLAAEQKGEWTTTNSIVHLAKDSYLTGLNHGNWRSKATANAFLRRERDLHYTVVASVSRADIERLREMVFKFLDDTRKIMAPSKEEELVCLNCDFFEI